MAYDPRHMALLETMIAPRTNGNIASDILENDPMVHMMWVHRDACLHESECRLLREPSSVVRKQRVLPGSVCARFCFMHMLAAAIVNANLQCSRVVGEARTLTQHSPTVFVVVGAVTFNKQQDDSDLVCGISVVDRRGTEPIVTFSGLGADPERFCFGKTLNEKLKVTEKP